MPPRATFPASGATMPAPYPSKPSPADTWIIGALARFCAVDLVIDEHMPAGLASHKRNMEKINAELSFWFYNNDSEPDETGWYYSYTVWIGTGEVYEYGPFVSEAGAQVEEIRTRPVHLTIET